MNPIAFTLKANGLMSALKTECGVGLPYDPNSGGVMPQPRKVIGLWDTGATGSVVSKNLVQLLNLTPTGKVNVFHANGSCIVNTYIVNLYLPNGVAFSFVTVTEGDLNGMDLLIGMDIITKGDFSISNFDGKTCFSFRMPSVCEKDFVHEIAHTPIIKIKTLERNDPCNCGSGRKFKNCCMNK